MPIMAVPQKPYPTRRNGYYVINGERHVSVTTVLNVLAKPALVHWAAKTAATLVLEDPEKYSTCEAAAGGIYTARDKAADRGSLVHSLVEAITRRAEVDRDSVPDHVRGYMQAFLSWVSLTQPTPLFSECTVYNREHLYAGTCDFIAAFPDRKVRMIDIKTGGIYPEVGLQLEAYRRCEYLFPRVNGDPAHPVAMPPVSETAVLLLREDGTYDYRPIIGDFDAFLAAVRLWRWTKEVT
jgi:hypothetical protein